MKKKLPENTSLQEKFKIVFQILFENHINEEDLPKLEENEWKKLVKEWKKSSALLRWNIIKTHLINISEKKKNPSIINNYNIIMLALQYYIDKTNTQISSKSSKKSSKKIPNLVFV